MASSVAMQLGIMASMWQWRCTKAQCLQQKCSASSSAECFQVESNVQLCRI